MNPFKLDPEIKMNIKLVFVLWVILISIAGAFVILAHVLV